MSLHDSLWWKPLWIELWNIMLWVILLEGEQVNKFGGIWCESNDTNYTPSFLLFCIFKSSINWSLRFDYYILVDRCTCGVRSDWNCSLPIKMVSKFFYLTTIIFVFEIASRGYIARLNRSSDEDVMTIWRRLREAVKTGKKARVGRFQH